MPTVSQLLTDIQTRLPYSTNSFTDGTVIGWMNDTQQTIWRYLASTDIYEFDTVGGQAIYTYASDMKPDKIKSVQKSNSTVIDGAEEYITLTYCGPDDELSGNQWYDAEGGIGIYPTPTTDEGGYSIKITYEPAPVALSTNTLSTVPSINVEYQDILKWRVCRDIAASGQHPDVDLANNYAAMYNALFDRIRMDYEKRKARLPRSRWDYGAKWWTG